ncbi:MAG: ABC transporter permease [Colwellia sp.]|nr:ABC transporter permease [Colwellia sp.]
MAKVLQRHLRQIWLDVIYAIFLRELKSKSSDKFGIAWSVVSPVVFIFMLSYLRGRMDGGDTHGIPTFFFMVYGMILVQFFMGLVASVSAAIKKNKPLYAFRQVQPISSILAITLFECLVKIFVILVIGVMCFILQFDIHISDPLSLLFNLLRVAIFSMSIGIIFSLLTCFVPEVDKVKDLLMRPMFFISGVFFSLQDVPQEYWPYLTWNPVLHAIELTRYAVYPQYGNAGVSDLYLNVFTLTSLGLALACYHISWKQAISR